MKLILSPEQKSSLKAKLIEMGYKTAVKVFGGAKKILELIFDGNVKQMLGEFGNIPTYFILSDKLYIHGLFINSWDLPRKNEYSYFLGRYMVTYKGQLMPIMVTISERASDGPYHRVNGLANSITASGGLSLRVGLGPEPRFGENAVLSSKERKSVLKKVINEYNLDYSNKLTENHKFDTFNVKSSTKNALT